MRVIFETPTVPVQATVPPRGDIRTGSAHFVVRAFDVGEEVPDVYDYALPVSEWLASLSQGQPLRSSPPEHLSGALKDAVVPRAILDALPPEVRIAPEWEFIPDDL